MAATTLRQIHTLLLAAIAAVSLAACGTPHQSSYVGPAYTGPAPPPGGVLTAEYCRQYIGLAACQRAWGRAPLPGVIPCAQDPTCTAPAPATASPPPTYTPLTPDEYATKYGATTACHAGYTAYCPRAEASPPAPATASPPPTYTPLTPDEYATKYGATAACYAGYTSYCPKAKGALPSPVTSQLGAGGRTEVALHREGGTFTVPVSINGAITLDFTLDSGAADVSITADVVLTLMRAGTIDHSDFLGSRTYVLADGSTVPSTIFRIRSLRVGDREVRNVTASIASVKGGLLLGQSFLRQFGSWSIDNRRGVLVLD
jgi:predicted aspartyl protease